MAPGLIVEIQENVTAGLLGQWLESRGIPTTTHRIWDKGIAALPEPDDRRFVVVLGSAESATRDHPQWIPALRAYIGRAAQRDVPVLGICLGSQMLSQALGGSVSAMPRPEIFWGNLEIADPEMPAGPWLVWHYDAFTLPPGATELARTERAPLAFRKGPHLGVQFHAEATPEIASKWAEAERERFAKWQLDPGKLRRAGELVGEQAASAADRLFDYWWRELVNGSG